MCGPMIGKTKGKEKRKYRGMPGVSPSFVMGPALKETWQVDPWRQNRFRLRD